MSGTSYPSPISSTGSSGRTGVASPLDNPSSTSATNGHDPIDTQRSLHQASAALEAAYNRIRQVRRNLLELTETLPPSQTRESRFDDIEPGHEATDSTLAPTEESEATNEDDGSALPPNIHSLMGRLMRYERMLNLDTARDSDLSLSDLPQRASSQSSTNRPPFLQTSNNNSYNASRRRFAIPDDAATSLGRRVAAREAAGLTPSRNTSRFPLVGRELESLRLSMRQRRTTGPQRLEPLVEHRPEDASPTNYGPAQRFTQVGGPSTFTVQPYSEPRQGLGEPRLSQSTATGSTHSERLSLLSNLSVQNLATPGSGSISRPLLFDEPSSYVPVANFTLLPEYQEQYQDPVGEDRNYVIRRRMNADGEEHIHPINLDWSDDEVSWILPRGLQDEATYDQSQLVSRFSRLSARYHPRRNAVQPNQTPSGRQRRRGWARLDADGNEIPSDEEEEIERIRTEHRVRAQNLPRPLVAASTQGVEVRPRLHALHPNPSMPNTRTGVGPDEDSHFDADTLPRVHLGPHEGSAVGYENGRLRHASPSRHHRSQPKPIDRYTHTTLPFCVNPLPMPLEEMLPVRKPNKNDHPRVIKVLKHAIFAGR